MRALTPYGENGGSIQVPFGVDCATSVVAGVLQEDGRYLEAARFKENEPRDPNGAAGQNLPP